MEAVRIDPEILGGIPCFAGTRVPVESLFDHLAEGFTVEEFMHQFPRVAREQIDAVLAMAKCQFQRPQPGTRKAAG